MKTQKTKMKVLTPVLKITHKDGTVEYHKGKVVKIYDKKKYDAMRKTMTDKQMQEV